MNPQPKSLFIIGNKRSGTSHLVRLLNASDSVFVTPESDVMWIILQRYNGVPLEKIERHPWDGGLALGNTLKSCADIFRRDFTTREDVTTAAYDALQRIRSGGRHGTPLPPLQWLGDKKPVQHVDPAMRGFIGKMFPHSAYIHIIRHPQAVITSMQKAVTGKMPWMDVCWDLPADALLARWVQNEHYVMDAKKEGSIPVLSVTFNEICAQPRQTMETIFNFLDVSVTDDAIAYCESTTKDALNRKYEEATLPLTDDAKAIIDHYQLTL